MSDEALGPDLYMRLNRVITEGPPSVVIYDRDRWKFVSVEVPNNSLSRLLEIVAKYEDASDSPYVADITTAFVVTMHQRDDQSIRRLYTIIDHHLDTGGIIAKTLGELLNEQEDNVD